MASTSATNVAPDRDLVELIATELGVDPAFVEKDWHATRVLSLIARTSHEDIHPVFSGGTSLSKGYGLIRRFSEDLDFKVAFSGAQPTRRERKAYRNHLLATLADGGWEVPSDLTRVRNEGRFFSYMIQYRPEFSPNAALRPMIKLEISFLPPVLEPQRRALRSLVAQALEAPPEVPDIACVSPLETAADKLSALCWRVLARDRTRGDDDPTIIRHLHDLAALDRYAAADPDFPRLVRDALAKDARARHASGPQGSRWRRTDGTRHRTADLRCGLFGGI